MFRGNQQLETLSIPVGPDLMVGIFIVSLAKISNCRLTLTFGVREGGSNTCINWLLMQPVQRTV
ncbi:MAG TPA: hypothetical protein DCP67_04190 [Planctomycetaceae bacterium]|nr:hypothetical protein [Planctomycetaceae bacterium]